MACDPEPPEAQALWRAAERGGIAGRLFEPDRRLEGYAWYDAIERIVSIHTEATVGRRQFTLDRYPVPERNGAPEAPLPQRPDSIRIGLTVRPGSGRGTRPRPRRRCRLRGRTPGPGSATPCRW